MIFRFTVIKMTSISDMKKISLKVYDTLIQYRPQMVCDYSNSNYPLTPYNSMVYLLLSDINCNSILWDDIKKCPLMNYVPDKYKKNEDFISKYETEFNSVRDMVKK